MPKRGIGWTERLASGETAEEVLEALYYEDRTDQQCAVLIGAMLGRKITESAVRQKRQSMGLGKGSDGAPLIKPATSSRYDKVPRLDGDTLVLGDIHVPYHDGPWLNRCISLALLWGCKNCLLAGDIVDLSCFSSFTPFFLGEADEEIDLEGQFEQAGRIFDALDEFEKVLYICGGHEMRILRYLREKISVSRFAAMFTSLPQLEMSAYHKAQIGDDWHISHPRNVSVIPARVPFFLVRKIRKNVAIAHDHVWGAVQDESGKNIALSIGVACDPKRLDYIALRDNTRPQVCQGALIIKNNYPWLLSPKWTDFKALRSIKW